MPVASPTASKHDKRPPSSRPKKAGGHSHSSTSIINANSALLLAPVLIVSFLIRWVVSKRSRAPHARGRGVQVVGASKPRRDYKSSRQGRHVTVRGSQQQQQQQQQQDPWNGAALLGNSPARQGQEQAFLQVLQQMRLHAMQHDGSGDDGGLGPNLLDDWADNWAPDMDDDYFYDEDEDEYGNEMAMDMMDSLGAELTGNDDMGHDMGSYLDGGGDNDDGMFNDEDLDDIMAGIASDVAWGPPLDYPFEDEEDDYDGFPDEFEVAYNQEDMTTLYRNPVWEETPITGPAAAATEAAQ